MIIFLIPAFGDFSGGEAQTGRTHIKREENITSSVLSFPCEAGMRF